MKPHSYDMRSRSINPLHSIVGINYIWTIKYDVVTAITDGVIKQHNTQPHKWRKTYLWYPTYNSQHGIP